MENSRIQMHSPDPKDLRSDGSISGTAASKRNSVIFEQGLVDKDSRRTNSHQPKAPHPRGPIFQMNDRDIGKSWDDGRADGLQIPSRPRTPTESFFSKSDETDQDTRQFRNRHSQSAGSDPTAAEKRHFGEFVTLQNEGPTSNPILHLEERISPRTLKVREWRKHNKHNPEKPE